MDLSYYIKGTGEIVATSQGEAQPSLSQYATVKGLWPGDRYYVSNGEPKEKREFPVTVSGLKLQNVPLRTSAVINGEVFEVNDGAIEVIRPGGLPVRIILRHINYVTQEFVL